jgi:hypothetical protein
MKFVIYKGTGGLSHMCRGVITTMNIASKTDRHLVIDCKSQYSFKRDFYEYFALTDTKVSHGSDFGIIPSGLDYNGIPVEELVYTNAGCKKNPAGGQFYGLNHADWDSSWVINSYEAVLKEAYSEKPVVIFAGYAKCAGVWHKHIKVRDSIVERLVAHKKNCVLSDKAYIGVHFRNTDLQNDFALFTKRILDSSAEHNISTVYLATDDAHAYSKFKKALAGIDLVQFVKPEDFGGQNIHYQTKDNDKQINDCLLDMYMLLTAKVFIPSRNSTLSKWLGEMADSGVNIFDISDVSVNAT